MKRTAWLSLLAVATLSACSQQTRIINDAAAALGGSEQIQAVRTLTIEGEGTLGNLGQDMRPDATSQTYTVTDYTRAIDLAAGRARVEQTRTPNFTYFQGPASQKQVMGIDGDVGYNVAPNGNAARVSDAAANNRRAEMYHHPLMIVRAALDPAAQVENPRNEDSQSVVDITTSTGLNFTLAIDNDTKLPTRVTSRTYNTNLGDVTIETSFADYQDVNGLQLPARLTTNTDNIMTADIRVANQTVDGDVGDLAAPAAAASAAPMTGPPPANVTVEEVATGIWLLAGQSHHSVLVEFSDHLTLFEAPQNDTRALAVIAKARELRPDKPLTHLVNSHHHFDHSGGIRAAVSEGLTIITHQANASFYSQAVERPHTIMTDALARNPMPLKIETVDDEMVLQDDTMTVNLYHIAASRHADTLLMAYFPRERLLVEADPFSPGRDINPFAANLLENVRRLNLRIDRIVPMHGGVSPFSELVRVAQAASTN